MVYYFTTRIINSAIFSSLLMFTSCRRTTALCGAYHCQILWTYEIPSRKDSWHKTVVSFLFIEHYKILTSLACWICSCDILELYFCFQLFMMKACILVNIINVVEVLHILVPLNRWYFYIEVFTRSWGLSSKDSSFFYLF